jgi:hypothetical protein
MHPPATPMGAIEADSKVWKAVEDHVISQAGGKYVVFAAARTRHHPFTAAFAMEVIRVRARVSNPLGTRVELKRMRLACVHLRNAEADAVPDVPPFVDALDADLLGLCARGDEHAAATGVREQDVVIGAHETACVTLELAPQEEGWVRVQGLQWDIEVPPEATSASSKDGSSGKVAGRRAGHSQVEEERAPLHAACLWAPPRRRCKCAQPDGKPPAASRGASEHTVWHMSDGDVVHAAPAQLSLSSLSYCRFATEEASRIAGESMHGLPISRAMHAADAAQAPALAFTEQSCLTFSVQPPALLLSLQPAVPREPLAAPALDTELAERVFAGWQAAGRPLRVPESVLAGELVPVALVVTRRKGQDATALRLCTSGGEVALLRGTSIGVVSQSDAGHPAWVLTQLAHCMTSMPLLHAWPRKHSPP